MPASPLVMEDRVTVTEPAPSSPTVPAWIRKRDGRLVPFEADKISQSLFAVTEELGRPDAFLARELTDSVLHFLALESEGTTPATAQLRELIVKVVRELGQPALAQAFADPVAAPHEETAAAPEEVRLHVPAEEPLPALLEQCCRDYTLRTVFARDLASAQRDGLLALTALETPFELASCTLVGPTTVTGLVEAIEATRRLAGHCLILDGPEYALAHAGANGVNEYVRELGIGLRATGLRAVVNLNAAVPPSWADDLALGPLFAGTRRALDRRQVVGLADALLEQLLHHGTAVRLDWHLGDCDFRSGPDDRLRRVARAALDGADVAFILDRPRQPVVLAEGADRQHPAVLLTVGLVLPRLAEQVPSRSVPLFLQKLGSLVRLGLSAGAQKREFLRRHSQERPAVTRGFLLDRARLVVAPVGLDRAVRLLMDRELWAGGPALELARQVVQRLREVLQQDAPTHRLEVGLDGSWLAASDLRPEALTPTALGNVKHQLRPAADLGTAVVMLAPERLPAAEQLFDWLRWVWQQTNLTRVRLVRPAPAAQQLTVPWPEER